MATRIYEIDMGQAATTRECLGKMPSIRQVEVDSNMVTSYETPYEAYQWQGQGDGPTMIYLHETRDNENPVLKLMVDGEDDKDVETIYRILGGIFWSC